MVNPSLLKPIILQGFDFLPFKTMQMILFSLSFIMATYSRAEHKNTNIISKDRMLLVLAAPSLYEKRELGKRYEEVVNFQIEYAKTIMGKDNVVVILPKKSVFKYQKELPEDVLLLTDEGLHIWLRDFTTINPIDPVQFTYTWASMSKRMSRAVQRTFTKWADELKIQRRFSKLILDGGNVVDNYAGKAVVTDRFLEDNNLTCREGKKVLKKLLGLKGVAIIETEYGDALGHSDGVVMWVENDVLLLNDYSKYDRKYRKKLLTELKTSFPKTTIIEIPVQYTDDDSSAIGINVNSTVTYKNIYVPVYGMSHEKKVLEIIRKNTSKKVFKVKSNGVAPLGGSVRCLTWQLTGENAKKLILAAQKKHSD